MEFALFAPRPRDWTTGCTFGGSGPTIVSSGSESEPGFGERRLGLLVDLRARAGGEDRGERERSR